MKKLRKKFLKLLHDIWELRLIIFPKY